MKEVSCRAFEAIDRAVRSGHLAPDAILAGTHYSLSHLRNKHERIEWQAYCQIIRNASGALNQSDFEQLGASFASSPGFRAGMIVARLLFRPTRVLQWMQSMEREGHEMFTCITSKSFASTDNRFSISLNIDSGYEDCPEFFYITKGTLAAIPPLLGSDESTMTCTIGERHATYNMYVPPREGVVSRISRTLSTPFRTAEAAKALQEAHGVLQVRYLQLEAAQGTLDRQAGQLRAAHVVNEGIQHSLEISTTLNAVVESLYGALDLAGAEIFIESDSEDHSFSHSSLFGTKNAVAPISRDVFVRHQAIGNLVLWPKIAVDVEEIEATLDFVLPNILIAIENALHYEALQQSRDELEQRVTERTAELRLARDQLTQSVGELENAQAARARIFANINHEIRTPLAVVSLACEEAREANHNKQPDVVDLRLTGIDTALARLLRLVDGLLLLAAGDEGQLRLRLEPVQLTELIQAEVQAWVPLARNHGIDLRCAADRPVRRLMLDPKAIAGVLGNLLSNAIKFTPSGGSVEVRLEELDDRAVVSVIDTGIGMSEEFRARAFDRFSQEAEPVSSEARGSGIGLSIVREVVTAHGGTIEAAANPQGGSSMVFSLPISLGDSGEDSEIDAEAQVSPVRAVGPIPVVDLIDDEPATEDEQRVTTHCVLIAEDEGELRAMMVRSLQPHFRVLSAANGKEALAMAEQYLPDLLVTDIAMPQMDGLELTRRFVQIPRNRAARALLVTAEGSIGSRLEGFEAGAVDYITKPFHRSEFVARVRAQLSIRDVLLKLNEVEKVASIGILGAGLAHELRNPLNVVVNALQPLRKALPAGACEVGSRAHSLLTLIETGAQRMQDISRSIGQLENTANLVLEPTRVDVLFAKAMSSLPTLPSERVTIHCAPELAIDCAPVLMQQVLMNILENALHSCGPTGSFEITATQCGDDAVIWIANDGPPIEPGERERVFLPFFTTKDPGKGTGLGLAISRQTVQRHGGTLRVVDSNDGCTFEIRLSAKRRS